MKGHIQILSLLQTTWSAKSWSPQVALPIDGNHHPNSGENLFLALLCRRPPSNASLVITLGSALLWLGCNGIKWHTLLCNTFVFLFLSPHCVKLVHGVRCRFGSFILHCSILFQSRDRLHFFSHPTGGLFLPLCFWGQYWNKHFKHPFW